MNRSLVLLPLLITACGPLPGADFDAALLAEFRAAVPTEAQLTASAPEPSSSARDVGDPALFPHQAVPTALAINGAVTNLVHFMRDVTSHQPTAYDGNSQEFLWGPWDWAYDYGTVAAYVVRLPEGEDFEFAYALLRGEQGDAVEDMSMVLWGMANPDPLNDEDGLGVTLWDYTANDAFSAAHDPAYVPGSKATGRFAAIYHAGPDADDPAARSVWGVAAFRDFVGADETYDPRDLDYLYGRHTDADGLRVDFVDFDTALDVDEDGSAAEDLRLRMAFINGGWGRAEVEASGGDMASDENATAIECWDNALGRQFLDYTQWSAGASQTYLEPAGGDQSLCVVPDGSGGTFPLFANTLDQLAVPSLDDIDPTLMDALDCAAEGGVEADCG